MGFHIGHALKSLGGSVVRAVGHVAAPIAHSVGHAAAAALDRFVPGMGQAATEMVNGVGKALHVDDMLKKWTGSIGQDKQESPNLDVQFGQDYGGADSSNGLAGLGFISNYQPATPTQQGLNTRAMLDAAYPELNPWEKAGTGGTMFGSDFSGQQAQNDAQMKQLMGNVILQRQGMAKDVALAQLNARTQLAINANNNQTALDVAGLQSGVSRQNTVDQVRVQQQNADTQRSQSIAQIQNLAANTKLTGQSLKESISRTVVNYAQANNLKLSAGQIQAATDQLYASAMASRASAGASQAQTGLISQQTATERERTGLTHNQADQTRYGQGPVMGTVNSIGNVFDDLTGAIHDKWNSMWNDSGGVSGSMSRK